MLEAVAAKDHDRAPRLLPRQQPLRHGVNLSQRLAVRRGMPIALGLACHQPRTIGHLRRLLAQDGGQVRRHGAQRHPTAQTQHTVWLGRQVNVALEKRQRQERRQQVRIGQGIHGETSSETIIR